MQHDEFIGQVQSRARLASRGEAEAATRATLETLGERVPETVASKLASQLPQELGGHLQRTITLGGAGTGERFGLEEFTDRVAQREIAERPDAVFHSRVVLEVLDEATQGTIRDKVRDMLPEEFHPLLDSGSSGRMDA